jgi:hypothetical protein
VNEKGIGIGTGTGTGNEKERSAHPWPPQWVLVRTPFLTTTANAIACWKPRSIIVTATAIVTETETEIAEELAHIRLRSLPLRPRFPPSANPDRVRP